MQLPNIFYLHYLNNIKLFSYVSCKHVYLKKTFVKKIC